MNILDHIVRNKRAEISQCKTIKSLHDIRVESASQLQREVVPRSLKKALLSSVPMGVIAEIKRRSPSKGALTTRSCEDFAHIYAHSDADAISVLTDKKYFGGTLSSLSLVRSIAMQPIFRKDFIIDEYQIYETVIAKGDAFLLIAKILSVSKLREFLSLGSQVGLESIVEIHDEEDLMKTLDAGAEMIGVNNRNLETFEIDLSTTEKLAKKIPRDKIIISESGISSKEDVIRLSNTGAQGILVGSSLVTADDPVQEINKLKNI